MRKIWQKSLAFLLALSLQSAMLVYAEEGPGNEELPDPVIAENSVDENGDVIEEDAKDGLEEFKEELTDGIIREKAEDAAVSGDVKPEEDADGDQKDESGDVSGDVLVLSPGWNQMKNGDWYYADQSGQRLTGWQLINKAWYYLDGADPDKPGVMLSDQKKVIDNHTYFFGHSGAMQAGWVKRPEGWYYTDRSGAMLTGWQFVDVAWYYLDGENKENSGLMLSDCKSKIEGKTYFFDGSGGMKTGWVKRPEGWYYANGSGAMLTGWQLVNGTRYYLDGANAENSGLMLSNCNYKIDGKTYAFDESGGMKTGWVQRAEGWYYADANGTLADGWRQINEAWYYLDGANEEHPYLMLSNCERQIDGLTYHFNASGAMRAGWYLEGKDWYYYDTVSGQIVSGWKKIGGTWYYLNPDNDNKMESGGWRLMGETWYYFHSSGAMATNWLLLGGSWYYLGADGAMRTGWQFIGYKWYYMYTADDPHGGSEGVMASNTTIDGYQLAADGAWYTRTEMMARNVLDRVGWSLRSAFNWSARMPYQKMTADPSRGSEWFANYGFDYSKGNCYVMAATFCYMARQLGYDAHQMAGMVPTRGGGLTPHSWVEVNVGGTIYVFDPDFTNETGRNGYQISYGTSGTWRYSNYYRMN